MRWRLIRRRLSISAPHMAVRSHLPWPVRWAVAALMLGFSAALALWAFEVGRNIAGLGHGGLQRADEVAGLHAQLEAARKDRDAAQSVANSADSLLKAERVTQQRLAEQVKALEAENLALQDDLGFFERLMPTRGSGLAVRGMQFETPVPGQLHFQVLVMQQGARKQPEFKGRVELLLSGLKDGQPWVDSQAAFSLAVTFRQYRRVAGDLALPTGVTVQQVQVRVLDDAGQVRVTQVQAL